MVRPCVVSSAKLLRASVELVRLVTSPCFWRSSTTQGYYVVGDGANPTVAELTEAAAVAAGAPGAVPGSDDEARARLGDYFAEVLLLDQGTTADLARTSLGWQPSHPSLADEFRRGSYRS